MCQAFRVLSPGALCFGFCVWGISASRVWGLAILHVGFAFQQAGDHSRPCDAELNDACQGSMYLLQREALDLNPKP